MAASLSFLFETLSKQLAGGLALPLGLRLPRLRQEDIVPLSVGVITQTANVGRNLYTEHNLAGWDARASIGTAASVLAADSGFAIDATSKRLEGILDLNTAGINALTHLQAGVYFELLFTDPNGNKYGASYEIRIEKAIFLSGSIIPPPSETALGRLEAYRNFLKKEMDAGEGIIWQSADGLSRSFEYLHNDGSKRDEPIT